MAIPTAPFPSEPLTPEDCAMQACRLFLGFWDNPSDDGDETILLVASMARLAIYPQKSKRFLEKHSMTELGQAGLPKW